ncbi:MAG: cytochrome c oxidase assembly factor Coa1 family protein [Bradymonadaceae bacterium]
MKQSKAVEKVLGHPVEADFWVGGQIQTSGQGGAARLNFSVSGPKGSGSVRSIARRKDGE